jgi:succinate dehydrogenase/fumarate reductase cytochrome b subunit
MAIKTSVPFISFILYSILFITTFCITFFSGTMIRHILWDYNIALELKTASFLGYIITAFSCFFAITTVSIVALI